jgi:hypothetical protein
MESPDRPARPRAPLRPRPRYRCRWCGATFNAYLPWAKAPNTALLLGHLSQQHMELMSPYL